MPPRPCLTCGALTTNGARHAHCTTTYTYGERQRMARVVADWRAQHGDWCPGWGTPPHLSIDLTADHVIPISQGGTGGPLTVACRACNSRRGTTAAH